MAKRNARSGIKADLLSQLKRNGTVTKFYTDLVGDYMEMYDAKNKLAEDIQERGVTVAYYSNNGTVNIKKNESVGEFLKVNAQMIKLLDSMGIVPAPEVEEDDEM